jgi:molybdopterin synthase catalytic subunit
MHIQIHFTHTLITAPPVIARSSEIGAIAEFWGVVREQEGSQKLAGLFYEAHTAMAEKQLTRILQELDTQHPCDCFEFIHRLGWVPVGEPSLWVRVQSRHRAEAFALLSESIRRMKMDVPIWKNVRANA